MNGFRLYDNNKSGVMMSLFDSSVQFEKPYTQKAIKFTVIIIVW